MASFGQAMPTMARPGQRQSVPPPAVAAAAGAAIVGHHHHHQHQPPQHGPPAPQGTFASGTKIQVGSHRVVIQRYLSEGGFAHVYVVKLPAPVGGTDLAVLKRVAVPDKDSLRSMRTEVETMKRLKGHRAIVTYIDSHASELRGGGYEVFLLMEYCDGGGLMDFMNTRLQHRLTEPEILAIFSDVAEGVACMHYLKPPLLHRDLKVENVLISKGHGSSSSSASSRRRFKLCDFGSAAAPIPAPASVAACRQLDEDIQMHTTLQYRSPEMVDVYRRQPVDEKSDIWALGVLLYKLCYYTTPFEDQASQLAILNASYRFPSHPLFSERLKSLIASMLRENQQARPNIYQVLREACAMQGKEVPIKNIYTSQPPSDGGRPHAADKLAASTATPVVGAVFSPPTKQQQPVIPDIVPMRRGRPTASSSSGHHHEPAHSPQPPQATKKPPTQHVANGDPFAALDAANPTQAAAAAALAADELSARFPTLDQFTLLHDHGTRFSFDSGSPPDGKAKDLSQRVAERLADDAFASSVSAARSIPKTTAATTATAVVPDKASSTAPVTIGIHKSASEPQHPTNRPTPMMRSPSPTKPAKPAEMSRASAIISSTPALQAISAQRQQQQQHHAVPVPVRPPAMVSTGTMTSPPPTPPPPSSAQAPPQPQHSLRASSLPRGPYHDEYSGGSGEAQTQQPARPPSQMQRVRHVSSSRPSLEGARPGLDVLGRVPSKEPSSSSLSLASSSRPRPASAYMDSSLGYLRERESSGGGGVSSGSSGSRAAAAMLSPSQAEFPPPSSVSPRLGPSPVAGREETTTTIESNVEYLRSMEELSGQHHHHHHHHHRPFSSKRSSVTLQHAGGSGGSGKKSILSGKFGDAFKRFETSTGGAADAASAPATAAAARTPSPLKQLDRQDISNRGRGDGGRNEYDGDHRYGLGPGVDDNVLDDGDDDRTPEARREIERRRLSLEEKRVAAAGAEYRQRLAQRHTGSSSSGGELGVGGGGSGGSSYAAPPPLPKSIGGVSRAVSIQNRVRNLLNESTAAAAGPPSVTRTAQGYGRYTEEGGPGGGAAVGPAAGARPSTATSLSDMQQRAALTGGAPRPLAKPKPMHLNKAGAALAMRGGSGDGGRPGSPTMGPPSGATRPRQHDGSSDSTAAAATSQLVAMDLPGQPVLEGMSAQDKDDYIRDFTRRFPSLTTIEKEEAPGRGW